MTDHDPIAHLDFATPSELSAQGELVRFESLEAERIKLLYAFFDHLHDLDTKYGPVDPSNLEQYVDRLQALEARMEPEFANLGLHEGDFVQANVPNLVYAADFMAEFSAGEAVRARFDRLAIYPHYDIAPDGELGRRLPFGLNLSVSEPMTVGLDGFSSIEGISGMNPMISLHHDSADLHRVVLPN